MDMIERIELLLAVLSMPLLIVLYWVVWVC